MTRNCCDIIVIGGGMAGLSAALSAAELGADAVVLEADTTVGGSGRWSSGRIWTLPDYEAFRQTVPLGDPDLQRGHAGRFEASLDWLAASVGSLARQPDGKAGVGRSMRLGCVGERTAYFEAFAAACRRKGADVICGASLVGLQTSAQGGFDFSYAKEGRVANVHALGVVLATGGYQGDAEMLQSKLGPEARRLMVRSNPNSRGAGIRAGLSVGGMHSRGGSGFYGKSMPLGAECLRPDEYKAHTFDVARFTIAVNSEGRRFVDETGGISGEAIPNASIYQPDDGRYFLILDGSQRHLLQSEVLASLAARQERPGSDLMLESDHLDHLADDMARLWGVSRAGLAITFEAVEAAFQKGHGQDLRPPRHKTPVRLTTAPFTAVACRPAITIPFGGLSVDPSMAVLDAGNNRIAGLFAAGADAGGAYVGAYAGGLAWALTSGRAAGLSAAALISSNASRKTMHSLAS